MVLIAEMVLPYLPVDTEEFDRDPFPYLETARREHPWLARCSHGYFVHGYQAVGDLLIRDDVLRPAMDGVVEYYDAQGTEWGRFMQENIVALWGERHARIRESVALAFTPRSVNRFRPLMRRRIEELLDKWAGGGRFDFAAFASDFPISIFCTLLGTPVEDIPRIRAALEAQGQVFSLKRETIGEMLAGYDLMSCYVDDLIVERESSEQSGDRTLLDDLIAAKNAGSLSETELRDLIVALFPGGYDTSKNVLSLLVYTLLDYPDYWQRCAQEPEFCAKVVEEMLRYSATASPVRIVAQDFSYAGIEFTEGTRLYFGNTVAGRDPAAFEHPDTFDPKRVDAKRHVAFGRGAHICVGQHLARAQIAEALHVIARRINNPRLAGEVRWRPFLGVWGPSTLPIEFDTPRICDALDNPG